METRDEVADRYLAVRHAIPPIEWPVYAGDVAAILELKRRRHAASSSSWARRSSCTSRLPTRCRCSSSRSSRLNPTLDMLGPAGMYATTTYGSRDRWFAEREGETLSWDAILAQARDGSLDARPLPQHKEHP